MNYLHYEVHLGANDVARVTLDKQANVLLLDPQNYSNYRRGRAYRYYGGLAKVSTVNLKPPGPGRWHVVVDLGGYPGTVKAGVEVVTNEVSVT